MFTGTIRLERKKYDHCVYGSVILLQENFSDHKKMVERIAKWDEVHLADGLYLSAFISIKDKNGFVLFQQDYGDETAQELSTSFKPLGYIKGVYSHAAALEAQDNYCLEGLKSSPLG